MSESERVAPMERELLLALHPLWRRPRFSLDLAWKLSMDQFHQERLLDVGLDNPSPCWLSAIDYLERHGFIRCMDQQQLSFAKDPLHFFSYDPFGVSTSTYIVESAWRKYLTFWAEKSAMINAALSTCNGKEALELFTQEEHHFMALFEFMLQHSTRDHCAEALKITSSKFLCCVLKDMAFILAGNMAHLYQWVLSPAICLALSRCISQVLDPYVPLEMYFSFDNFSINDAVIESWKGSRVTMLSRAFVEAKIELAMQLRTNGLLKESCQVLSNCVSLACGLPDCTDLPCYLTTKAFLQLALTQHEQLEKNKKSKNDLEIEKALAMDGDERSEDMSTSCQRHSESDKSRTSILALYERVVKFCDAFPRGEHQLPCILNMKGMALMGIKQMHLRRHAEAADEASPPSDDIPSDSQRALTVEKEQQEIRNYFDIVYKCWKCALENPFSCQKVNPLFSTDRINFSVDTHPIVGELYLREGEMFRTFGQLHQAKNCFLMAIKTFLSFFISNDTKEKFDSESTSLEDVLDCAFRFECFARPNSLTAQAFCNLGLILDELDEIDSALKCYSCGKKIYKVVFDDGCISVADISVNKAMLYITQNKLKLAQNELTDALQCLLFLHGHDHSDTIQVQNMLDTVTESVESNARSFMKTDRKVMVQKANTLKRRKARHKRKATSKSGKKSHHDGFSIYFESSLRFRQYHDRLVEKFDDSTSICYSFLSPLGKASLSARDGSFLDFNSVRCQREIDSLIVEAFIMSMTSNKESGINVKRKENAMVENYLQRALKLAHDWENREIRLKQLLSRETDAPFSTTQVYLDQTLCDVEQGQDKVAFNLGGMYSYPEMEVKPTQYSYSGSFASLYLASLHILLADHWFECCCFDFVDPAEQINVIKDISEQYEQALAIYRNYLGDTNLMVASVMVQYASHLLGFAEHAASVLGSQWDILAHGKSWAGFLGYVRKLFASDDVSSNVLPFSSTEAPHSNDEIINRSLNEINTAKKECESDAAELLEEASVIFDLLLNDSEPSFWSRNAFDGHSQYEVVVCPFSQGEEPGKGMIYTSCLSFSQVSIQPLYSYWTRKTLKKSYRGKMEAKMLLSHVYLCQDRRSDALVQCDEYLSYVTQRFGDQLPSSKLKLPTMADLAILRSAYRMQELEMLATVSEEKMQCRNYPSTELTPHIYGADAYMLKAQILQQASLDDMAASGESIVDNLLAGLFVLRRLFGDRDEQFIWMEYELQSNDEKAVKYEGEAYVNEGNQCGVHLEIVKTYNNLAAQLYSQNKQDMAIEMCNRSLVLLCDMNLSPTATDDIGQKIGLMLCNLGDLLTSLNRDVEAQQVFSLARDVFKRLEHPFDFKIWKDELSEMIINCKHLEPLDQENHSPHRKQRVMLDSLDSAVPETENPPQVANIYLQDIRHIDEMLEALDHRQHRKTKTKAKLKSIEDQDSEEDSQEACILM